MINNKDLFFVASAWNTGTGFWVKDYNFIITTIQVVGFSKKVVVRHSKIKNYIANVIFIDYSNGLVFLELPKKCKSNINILNFELSVIEQPVRIFRTNYNCDTISHSGEIIDNTYPYNNFNHLKIKFKDPLKVSGAVMTNNRKEIVGITKHIESEDLFVGLPAKYILKSLEEFSIVNEESVRCPSCLNIIKKQHIFDNVCPSCTAEIKEELTEDFIPKMSKVEEKIEKSLKILGYNIIETRLGRHFWEINEGSAEIFIKYEPKQKFIVAFSKLLDLKQNNIDKVYEYLAIENGKIGDLSFSIDNNRIFLNAPYIFDDDFNEVYAKEIFSDLFKKADYYDDIIEEMQIENL